MPHVNRIRLVNVGNTNSTQFYDEFHMGLFGRNVTYDLINGGGKTFLIQMILQTILPNSYLDKKNPLKNIFEGGKDRTSHIVVEWLLDEGSPYKYLLSGFCAKGSKKPGPANPDEASIISDDEEDALEDTSLEFFNYTHLYNETNSVDIQGLDLYRRENEKEEYKSLSSLKNYLRDLKKQGFAVHTFDTQRSRTEFKAFLNGYNIVPREWELIQQINQKENNIKSYFEQAKTSRKLVENLLIPIVADLNETGRDAGNKQGANLARELINIKEQFKEYQTKRDNAVINEMNINRCEQLRQSCDQLGVKYQSVEQVQQDAIYSHEAELEKLNNLADKIKAAKQTLDNNQLKTNKVGYQINCLSIQENEISRRELEEQKAELERYLQQTKEAYKQKHEEYLLSRAQNKYLDYCEGRSICHTTELKLQQLESSHGDLRDQLAQAVYNYRLAIDERSSQVEDQKNQAIDAYQKYSLELDQIESKIKDITQEIGRAKQNLENDKKRKTIVDEQETRLKIDLRSADCIWFLDDEIEPMMQRMSDQIEMFQHQMDGIDQDMLILPQRIEDSHNQKTDVSNELAEVIYRLKECELYREAVEEKKTVFHQVLGNYQISIDNSTPYVTEGLRVIAERKNRLREEQRESEKQLDQVEAELEKVEGRDYYIPNREVSMLYAHLQSRLDGVFLGAEYLYHNPERKAALLLNNPLLPYAVLVSGPDLERLKDHPDWIGTAFSDYAIPIIDLEAVKNNERMDRTRIIYTANLGDIPDDLEVYKKRLKKNIDDLARSIAAIDEQLIKMNVDEQVIRDYQESINVLQNKQTLEKQLLIKQAEVVALKNQLEQQISDLNEVLTKLPARRREIEAKRDTHRLNVDRLAQYRQLFNEQQGLFISIRTLRKDVAMFESSEQSFEQEKKTVQGNLESLKSKIGKFKEELEQYKQTKSELGQEGLAGEKMEWDYDESRSRYTAAKEAFRQKNMALEPLQKELANTRKQMDSIVRDLLDSGYDIACFDSLKEHNPLLSIADDVIARTKKEAEEIHKTAEAISDQVGELNNGINQLIGQIDNQKKNLGASYQENEAFQSIDQIRLEIDRLNQAKQDLIRGAKRLLEQLTDFEKELKAREKEAEKIASYMEINHLQPGPAYPMGCSQRSFADIQADTRKLNTDVEKVCQEFQKRLALIKDDNFSYSLKQEGAPQTASSAQLTSDNIQRYINLAIEVNVKLQADLERMADRQKQFITACYQPSEQLLSDLKKFDTFSKIEVHGKVRQMIQLILPEYSTEVKRLNMEKHIQHLIEGLDRDDQNIAANLNHLLSPAELLSKLVNMDQLQVKMYNIKQLREQSRMVPWEKLSTSDGQGNAVYFIFLICLLSFIRDIKTEGRQAGSRKTIIADNLFGPTTALYLWQPMLNIIKENNVQLIAPGSQINPMIASNFEINYKMRLERREGGKSFVKVVPDLSTSVEDLQQLELRKIEESNLFA
ncbi:MAG: hypothetical protein U9N81_10225 [Bacillota bacterium]|nr:hypothetical protein [Bacillota bacterium]